LTGNPEDSLPVAQTPRPDSPRGVLFVNAVFLDKLPRVPVRELVVQNVGFRDFFRQSQLMEVNQQPSPLGFLREIVPEQADKPLPIRRDVGVALQDFDEFVVETLHFLNSPSLTKHNISVTLYHISYIL
jgi:hypothetical protein